MKQKCYFNCKVTGPLHGFPSSNYPHEERFAQWKKVLSEETKSRGDDYIKNNVRICSRHFEKCYLTRSKRLTLNSVPTLDLSFGTMLGVAPSRLSPTDSNGIALPSSSTPIERNLYTIAPLPPRTGTDTTTKQTAIEQEDSQAIDEVIQAVENTDDTYLYAIAPLPPRTETVTTTKQTVIEQENTPAFDVNNTSTYLYATTKAPEPIRTETVTTTKQTVSQPEKDDTYKVRQLKMKVAKLQAKCKTLTQRLKKSERQVKSLSLLKNNGKVSNPALIFTKMQQQNGKKARGRRFSLEEKNFAMKIFKQSREAYNLMKTFFVLPSKRSLRKLTEEKRPKFKIIETSHEPLIDDEHIGIEESQFSELETYLVFNS